MQMIAALFFTLGCMAAQAKNFKTPWLSGPVIDEVGLLEPQHQQELNALLLQIRENSGPQIQIFITKSLQELPIEKASIDIVDQWKIGDAAKDDGLLFLIAPTERKVRIEVGQGLEGAIPDIYTKRINDDIVVPFFKNGQMSEGVYRGTLAIIGLLNKEGLVQLKDLAHPSTKRKKAGIPLPPWLVILIWVLFFIIGKMGGGGRGGRGLMRSIAYGSSGSWGGGFGSSGGGGGWSGGGGGFSGGGSSGSW
jgi:uncharacterized protein